jgi:transposase
MQRGLCGTCYANRDLRRCYPPGNDQRMWTDREDRRLIHMKSEGLTGREVASTLGRTIGQVEQRVKRLREKGVNVPSGSKKGRTA